MYVISEIRYILFALNPVWLRCCQRGFLYSSNGVCRWPKGTLPKWKNFWYNYFGQFRNIEKNCRKAMKKSHFSKTSRDRPKSAPYPRLKNSKKTSKCQVLFYSTRKSKFFEKKFFEKITYSKNWTEWRAGARATVSQRRKTERGDPLWFFNIHSVAKHEKIEENKNFHFREKISQCRKKTERGDPLGFFNIHSVAKHQKKMQGGPFREKFFFEKKVSQCRKKNERGESLVSPGMVCYAEKQEKPFWFSSLDQIVHFDAIIFCRTFVELFWSVRVDRKKRVTIIVAFHFMKRRLKMRQLKLSFTVV